MHRAALLLLLASLDADAIVIRDDVPDAEYRMDAAAFPALADLPGEGHGVLIAPQWVVTAAHAVSGQHGVGEIVVGGAPRAVRDVVIHPGYRTPPQALVEAALASGDWDAFFEFMESTDDLALVQLTEPVRDVAPVPIDHSAAPGTIVRIMGQGATGPGSTGHALHGPNRTALRQGDNELVFAEGRWLGYRFDAPPAALPREASSGSGDSGGPILVATGDGWEVAGVAAWKRGVVVGTEVRPGSYGEISVGVRLAHYAGWIDATIAKGEEEQPRVTASPRRAL